MGTPQIPASITTSYTVLRGIIHSLFGIPQIAKTDSSLQCTFLKDKPKLTGKFSIQLGKKFGKINGGEIALGEHYNEEVIYDIIAKAFREIIRQELPIYVWEVQDVETVELEYGKDVILEYPPKPKKKKGKETEKSEEIKKPKMVMCFIPNLILTTLPMGSFIEEEQKVLIYSNTKYLNPDLDILYTQGNHWESAITSTLKKAEIAIKFLIPQEMDSIELSCCDETKKMYPKDCPDLFQQQTRMGQLSSELKDALSEKKEAQKEEEAKQEQQQEEEMLVSAYEVKGKIDYSKLIKQFGSQPIVPDLLSRLAALVQKRRISEDVPLLHHFLRRGIFFSHRDLDKLVTCLEENKQEAYLYTGRGPSSTAMHLGHLVPFMFTQWLQSALNLPLVIQMTDDEKFIFKGEYVDGAYNLPNFQQLTIENSKDIIACGFIKEKTFIFSNMEYMGRMYPVIVRIWKSVTTNAVNSIFGFDGQSNIGKIAFPAIQAAPSFAASFFPQVLTHHEMICCIPCAIDQDPYFRLTRDVAHKLVSKQHALAGKPSLIHSKFFPPLQGITGKMSSSDPNTAIFLTDSVDEITKKIKQFAYSGGQELLAKQRELGANLDTDISYQWLNFFYQDDQELNIIKNDYGTGSGEKYWSTKLVKDKLIEVLIDLIGKHQSRRALVTNDIVKEWMTERPLS